jgi:hypothetical protein
MGVMALMALALMLAAGTGNASAQRQGGSDSTAAANDSLAAEVYAMMAFVNAVGTGDQAQINTAFDVFAAAYYGFISIDGPYQGFVNANYYFSITGQYFPGDYSEDLLAGGALEYVVSQLALNLFSFNGDPLRSTPISSPFPRMKRRSLRSRMPTESGGCARSQARAAPSTRFPRWKVGSLMARQVCLGLTRVRRSLEPGAAVGVPASASLTQTREEKSPALLVCQAARLLGLAVVVGLPSRWCFRRRIGCSSR